MAELLPTEFFPLLESKCLAYVSKVSLTSSFYSPVPRRDMTHPFPHQEVRRRVSLAFEEVNNDCTILPFCHNLLSIFFDLFGIVEIHLYGQNGPESNMVDLLLL